MQLWYSTIYGGFTKQMQVQMQVQIQMQMAVWQHLCVRGTSA